MKVRLGIAVQALQRAQEAVDEAEQTADSDPSQDNINEHNRLIAMRDMQQENLDSLTADIAEREKNLFDKYGVAPSRTSDEEDDDDDERTVTG